MFHRFVHVLAIRPLFGFGNDPGMPYADITPIRRDPVIHADQRPR